MSAVQEPILVLTTTVWHWDATSLVFWYYYSIGFSSKYFFQLAHWKKLIITAAKYFRETLFSLRAEAFFSQAVNLGKMKVLMIRPLLPKLLKIEKKFVKPLFWIYCNFFGSVKNRKILLIPSPLQKLRNFRKANAKKNVILVLIPRLSALFCQCAILFLWRTLLSAKLDTSENSIFTSLSSWTYLKITCSHDVSYAQLRATTWPSNFLRKFLILADTKNRRSSKNSYHP